MSSNGWGKNNADFNIFCKACPLEMGSWYPAGNIGFLHPIDATTATPGIYYTRVVVFFTQLSQRQLYNLIG